ncbi:exonuclease domain-containing protein [Rhodoferax sp.]|uniref:exonuclease domain-containing protein n=1 Tax=Rhodoferax sp. TaxID=50421 RepID=UPI002623A27B|nr:exonuclease domain-containing protein [Rhodoferax sp.]MDD2924566.1 exonuclease domain-containing protein [Rhodoferax sp.]
MLPCYVLLDLETTGGHAAQDRVTEIAAVRFEHGVEVARWSTLVNPGVAISGFIERLTGISNAMVADAPTFAQVGPQLLRLLDGAVLVAHNVRFDHGFLQSEFARLGVTLHTHTLCTVRLSRRLYPQAKGHGLDAIMQRHGITTASRHRAMGDVEVMQTWLQQVFTEFGIDRLRQHAQALLQGSAALPPQLDLQPAAIPEGHGVYAFHGAGDQVLHVGKSTRLRHRILSHFQAAGHAPPVPGLSQTVQRISWQETAGELGAQLLETRWRKTLATPPQHPAARDHTPWVWLLDANPAKRPLLTLQRGNKLAPEQLDRLYGPYRSRNQAISRLRELAETHQLCPQALGLTSGQGACPAHLAGRCQGLCCGAESPSRHNLRLQLALSADKLRSWPFAGCVGLREHDPSTGRTDIHLFDHWCHLATVHSDDALAEALQSRPQERRFDLDTYRLALKYLLQPVKYGATLVTF